MSWKVVHVGTEGDSFSIEGASVWSKTWKAQGEESIAAKHPSRPDQEHRLNRYFIEVDGKTYEFATAEVSPGVWLFALPEMDAERSVLLHIAAYTAAVTGCFIMLRGSEYSVAYVGLGAALVALAAGTGWYARSRRKAGVA